MRPLSTIRAELRDAWKAVDRLTAEHRATKKLLLDQRREAVKADYLAGMDRAEILERHGITGSTLSGLIFRGNWKRPRVQVKSLTLSQFHHYNRLRASMSRYDAITAASQVAA